MILIFTFGVLFLVIGIHGMHTNKAGNWDYYGNVRQIGVAVVLLVLYAAIFLSR